ncbi:hypothetical protein PVAND_013325 [Polypedilum vanderplanki]|uniref:Uncharacterized protein n=1 Tax=Polypedilum vanderplanki TaxID=319348 RepID=A0A9J6CQB2_POLVA|nr:hypothetical protein PVAND_013325 [Polypedilum vanderplanki]
MQESVFVTKKSIVSKVNQKIKTQFWKYKVISRGEWIAIKQEFQIFIGHVINFPRIHEKSELKRTFIHDFIDLDDIRSQNVYVMLNPLFQVINNFMKSVTNNDVFFNSSFYKCHVHDNNECPSLGGNAKDCKDLKENKDKDCTKEPGKEDLNEYIKNKIFFN